MTKKKTYDLSGVRRENFHTPLLFSERVTHNSRSKTLESVANKKLSYFYTIKIVKLYEISKLISVSILIENPPQGKAALNAIVYYTSLFR